MLAALIKALDQRILNDPLLTPSVLDQAFARQRELGLVFGDRPTCPFLRPRIMARSQYDTVATAARTIALAAERLAERALADDALFAQLGLTEREAKMARIDPGYRCLCVTSRLDAYVSEDGFKFLEYNAESPAGVGDQMQLEKVLFELPHNRDLLENLRNWRPRPHKRLLSALLDAYRDSGGAEERPQIAIVDWKGVATESEFRILQQYFTAEGFETIIADPRDLSYDHGRLRAGDFAIDIVYKRVVIHEFLDRFDETHPMARAYADGRVCMVNSFRTKLAHKKALFAILSDPKFAHHFTAAEVDTFTRHVPWTRLVKAGQATFEGDEHELVGLIRRERTRLVLKPNDDYGGHGVFLGWQTSPDDWERAISLALDRQYVVQERVLLEKSPIPTFSGSVQMANMFVDFNPFLFNNEVEGALIRLSTSPLLNMTAGGGQTALLVLEDV